MKIASINSFNNYQNKNMVRKNSDPNFKGSFSPGGKVVYHVVKEGVTATAASGTSFLIGALSMLGIGMAVAKQQQDNIRNDLGDKALEEIVMDRIMWDITLG